VLHGLERPDGPPELLPRLRVLDRRFQNPLHPADHLRAEYGRGRVERPGQRPARVAVRAEGVGLRHVDAREFDLVELARRVHRGHRPHAEPLGPARDGQQREPFAVARHADDEVGRVGVGHEEFFTLDAETPAAARRLHPDAFRAPVGPLFEQRDRRLQLARGDGLKVFRALLGAARAPDERGREERGEERPRQAGAAHLLGHGRHLDEPEAEPAVLLGDEQPRPALFGQRPPQPFVVRRRGLHQRAHAPRPALPRQEPARRLLQKLLRFAEIEVHKIQVASSQ
jgi:hypothetical protein